MTEANIADIAAVNFIENDLLASQAAAASNNYGHFQAGGIMFVVKALGWIDVGEEINKARLAGTNPDGHHLKAFSEGYPVLHRLAAVHPTGRVYAVWEVYAAESGSLTNSISRTIQVDPKWMGIGIGTQFARTVRSRFPVRWSGMFTASGARLKDAVERLENPPINGNIA